MYKTPMNHAFKKIALIAPVTIKDIATTLTDLVIFLQKQQRDIMCETDTAQLLSTFKLPTVEHAALGQHCDLIIVVGGDGSILRAAKNSARYQVPVLGLNRGKLGFLTDIRPAELETSLSKVLNGEFWVSERFFLHAEISHNFSDIALNDIVISSGRAPYMLELEVYINGEFVCSHRADGLIIATPTGSTAYALSGGGPILHPSIDALVMLPMFSHALTSRPIVVPGNSKISIKFSPHNKTASKISCDGNEIGVVPAGGSLTLEKYAHSMRLIHPLNYNFYQSLRSKLHWGDKLT